MSLPATLPAMQMTLPATKRALVVLLFGLSTMVAVSSTLLEHGIGLTLR